MGQASPSRIFFILMLVSSAALCGCGRRGPLELPPGAPGQAEQGAPGQAEQGAPGQAEQGAPGQAGRDTTALADKQAAALNETAVPGIIQSPNQVVQVQTTSAQLAAQPPSRAINAPPTRKPGTFLLDPLL